MHDANRPKRELVTEITALRKQVADLREAAVARRRVEDALRASEERYRSLLDRAPAGICRIGRRGGALVANPAFARLLGYDSRSELAELAPVLGLFNGTDEEARVTAQVQAATDAIKLEIRLRRKDGDPLTVPMWAVPDDGPDGQLEGMILFGPV